MFGVSHTFCSPCRTLMRQLDTPYTSNNLTMIDFVFQSAGLAFVHIHSRWVSGELVEGGLDLVNDEKTLFTRKISPSLSLWNFYLTRSVLLYYLPPSGQLMKRKLELSTR